MKYTPGPWVYQLKHKALTGERVWVFSEKTGEPIAMVHLEHTSKEDTNIHYANARLIAAAPDLVAALEKITKPEGAYSMDKLTHAENTIAAMIEIAEQALAKCNCREALDASA